MPSVDVRTRTPADIRPVDPVAFFDDELPALARDRGELAVAGARELDLRPLDIEVGDLAWQLTFDGEHVSITRRDPGSTDAPTILVLDQDQLADLVNDLRTPVGFLAGGDLNLRAGRLERVLDWWVVLRSLIDERPAYTSGSVGFTDPGGDPLDLSRAFTLHDDMSEAAHFLAQAGFLHLRGVFDEDEMAAVSAEMDDAAPGYTEGDKRSWWARTHDGESRLVRMQYFQQVSPTTARLLADDRLRGLARLTDDGHELGKPGGNWSLVEALMKPIGVVEGISDVPWHKDCSLGSHSYRCCSLTVGISVTGADAESGQLRVVPGSHRALLWPGFVRKGLDLPQIDLPTQTGDITIHCSCTLHMSEPPVTRERRVLYTDLALPTDEVDGSVNERRLKRIRERAHTTVSQKPGHVANG